MITQNARTSGPFLVLLGALCFSTTGTVQAIAPADATSYVISELRLLVGGLVLFLWCSWKKSLPKAYNWPLKAFIPAVLSLIGFQLFFFKSIAIIGVVVGTMVAIGFTPIAAAGLAFLLLKERPPRIWYPATCIALVGLYLLSSGGSPAEGEHGNELYGLFLSLSAGACYALYLICSKTLLKLHSPEILMMSVCLASGACLLPVFWMFPVGWLVTPTGLGFALYLGGITTALAYVLTLTGLKTTPTSVASTLGLAEPLGASFLGLFFLHEQLSTSGFVGIAFLFASVVLLVIPTGNKGK